MKCDSQKNTSKDGSSNRTGAFDERESRDGRREEEDASQQLKREGETSAGEPAAIRSQQEIAQRGDGPACGEEDILGMSGMSVPIVLRLIRSFLFPAINHVSAFFQI